MNRSISRAILTVAVIIMPLGVAAPASVEAAPALTALTMGFHPDLHPESD